MDFTTAKNRSLITQKIRDFFTENGFLEIETPIMVPIPGMEPYLTPFETSFSTPQQAPIPLYLNTSPELQMKKLLGARLADNSDAGFDKIFQLIKVFRNGEIGSPLHNPEFTMLEWYRKNADYTDMMNDCEKLILELVKINRLKSPVNGELKDKSGFSQRANADIASSKPSSHRRPRTSTQSANLQNSTSARQSSIRKSVRSQGGVSLGVSDPGDTFQSANLQNPDDFTVNDQQKNSPDSSQITPKLVYQSTTIDLTPPWPRFTTNELFIKYCGIDLLKNRDFETFKKTVDKLAKSATITPNITSSSHPSEATTAAPLSQKSPTTTSPSTSPFAFSSSGCATWDDLYFKVFLNQIEPELAKFSQPIFIYDYPATQAALAKKMPGQAPADDRDPSSPAAPASQPTKNTFFAERFELYICGIELANAFSELTDSKEQRARLEEEQNLRKQLGKTVFPIDEEFLQALDRIAAHDTKPTCHPESTGAPDSKPPCLPAMTGHCNSAAGIALGLDRLLMLLLDKKSIQEVLLFPFTT